MTTVEMYKGKYGSRIFVEYSVRASSTYEKILKIMHNICDERFLNLTVSFGFSPPKAPERTRNGSE